MDILDPTASASQRPLDGGVLVVLLSYPVSLSAAAAASVWTWLAVTVAGAWLWRVLSHQSASASARVKVVDASTAASHLLPPDAAAGFLQKQRVPQADLPFSLCPIDEIEEGVEEEIQPACSRPRHGGSDQLLTPQLAAQQDAFRIGRKTTVAYFEGYGSERVRDDEDEQVVKASSSSSSGYWLRDAISDSDFYANCFTNVVRCWDDARVEEEVDQASDNIVTSTVTARMSDLGWHRFQDWGVINGNVVRFWGT